MNGFAESLGAVGRRKRELVLLCQAFGGHFFV
jgi:hypothetical protein